MRRAASTLAVLILASACGGSSGGPPAPAGPPELRVTRESIDALAPPNPALNAPTPPEYAHGVYYRYRVTNTPIRAVLILVSGLVGGAGDFDYLARELLRMSDGGVEVWVYDRRPNVIEDHFGHEAARAARDGQAALDYYFGEKEVDGRTFAGFPKQDDVPFMSEWGLALLMEELRAMIERVPAPFRKTNVFLGGHSMGASATAYFAAWDFDGDADTLADAGFNQIAGAVLLDAGGGDGDAPIAEADYEDQVARIRDGRAERFEGGAAAFLPGAETLGLLLIPYALDDPLPARPRDVLTLLTEALWRGPANPTEWFFATRMFADYDAAGSLADVAEDSWQATKWGLRPFHTVKADMPVLAVGATRGIRDTADSYEGFRRAFAPVTRAGATRDEPEGFEVLIGEGYDHLTVIVAENEIGGENGLYRPILDFMLRNASGTVVVP